MQGCVALIDDVPDLAGDDGMFPRRIALLRWKEAGQLERVNLWQPMILGKVNFPLKTKRDVSVSIKSVRPVEKEIVL